jgi:hypothetical protein
MVGAKIVSFPSGGGPEDPMLEQRVVRLEEKLDRIETILTRLEPKITEVAIVGAKQSDIQSLRAEFGELKGKISMLPTWWMLLLAVIATWGAGAALVRFFR